MTDARVGRLRDRLNEARTERGRLNARRKKITATAADERRERLSTEEDTEFRSLSEQISSLDTDIDSYVDRIAELTDDGGSYPTEAAGVLRRAGVRTEVRSNPLAFTSGALDGLQRCLDTRSAGRFGGDDLEQRAALQTSTYGARREWGSNVLNGPRLLHMVAGVPQQDVDAALVAHPKLTLPTASASVGETVSLAEYASSTAGSVTLARYGRYTDFSVESQLGTDAGAIMAMHQLGIALDLDAALIDAVETAAGSAVAFTSDVPAAIRNAMASVIAATAANDVADLVVLVNPANAALLQSITPTGGETIGEKFQNFSGALVYPSSAVNTGFMTVANLKVGTRYFQARGLTVEADNAVKTGVQTVASSVIGGYGTGLVSGFAVMVDVVTP